MDSLKRCQLLSCRRVRELLVGAQRTTSVIENRSDFRYAEKQPVAEK
jgi:hypothetical protein